MGRPRRDILGQTFGRVTVTKDLEGGKNPQVKCRCACGKVFTADKHNVIRGNTQSCGCLKSEKAGRYERKKKEPSPPVTPEEFFDDTGALIT